MGKVVHRFNAFTAHSSSELHLVQVAVETSFAIGALNLWSRCFSRKDVPDQSRLTEALAWREVLIVKFCRSEGAHRKYRGILPSQVHGQTVFIKVTASADISAT